MTIAPLETVKTDLIRSFDVVVKIRPHAPLSDDEFFEFCRVNGGNRIEQTAEGEIIIIPPTGWNTTKRNAKLVRRLGNWAEADARGEVSESNGEFILPNGAKRAPDAAWVLKERVEKIPPEKLDQFLPLCPDFVVELASPSDSLKEIQEKMREYVENGAQLGWLIYPKTKRVYVYRPNCEV